MKRKKSLKKKNSTIKKKVMSLKKTIDIRNNKFNGGFKYSEVTSALETFLNSAVVVDSAASSINYNLKLSTDDNDKKSRYNDKALNFKEASSNAQNASNAMKKISDYFKTKEEKKKNTNKIEKDIEEFNLYKIKENATYFETLKPSFKKNKEFILKSLQKNYKVWNLIDNDQLINNKEFVIKALDINYNIWLLLDKNIKHNLLNYNNFKEILEKNQELNDIVNSTSNLSKFYR
jgi:hypothetical protein